VIWLERRRGVPVKGCACAGCTLCCKLLAVPELEKPAGQWCQNCAVGVGCLVHDEGQPVGCKEWNCWWRVEARVGDHWRPDRCGMVLSYTPSQLQVHVGPARPDEWRKEPYLGDLMQWSRECLKSRRKTVVVRNGRVSR
jgi:hypothetical protein